MRRMVIGLVVAALLMGPHAVRPMHASDLDEPVAHEEPSAAASLGWGMASVGTNLLYMPGKMVYALVGGLVGLMAWGVSAGNTDVAMGILQPALSGTWAVTPDMLRGEQPILFIGPSYESSSSSSSS
jgi:hypothetical protein